MELRDVGVHRLAAELLGHLADSGGQRCHLLRNASGPRASGAEQFALLDRELMELRELLGDSPASRRVGGSYGSLDKGAECSQGADNGTGGAIGRRRGIESRGLSLYGLNVAGDILQLLGDGRK